jgi:hypothetical protein
MKQFYLLFFLGTAFFFTIHLHAQTKFVTSINEKEIGKEDVVEVNYTVENGESIESINPPASFKGFTVVSGPNEQTGMTFINGNLSKYQSIAFILKPTGTGKFAIGGGTARVNGQTLRSNTVIITVSNTSHIAPSSGPYFNLNLPFLKEDITQAETVDEDYILRKNEKADSKILGNLFPKVDVSKTTCYQGEAIVATYKLYSRLRSESKVTRRPTLNGFSVYDMEPPNSDELKTERINGKVFYVHTIRKVQLYPLQEGNYEIDPVELDNTCRFLRIDSKEGTIQDLLRKYGDINAAGDFETQSVTLASKPISIKVNPLPEKNKPVNFDGAVGKFSITALPEKNEIALNETGKLIVEIKGAGNIPLINAPLVQWPSGIEGSEPIVTEQMDKTVAPINGTKQFTFDFNASQTGKLIIPAIEWTYFDPSVATYKIIKTDSFSINVTAASDSVAQLKQLQQVVNSNGKNSKTVLQKIWLWLVPALVGILLSLVYWVSTRKKKVITTAENKIALNVQENPVTPIHHDPLKIARIALYENNSRLFYQETGNAVWNTVAQKLHITSSELNKPAVLELLQKRNMPAFAIQQFEQVVKDCEMALYTPVHNESNMKGTLQNAASFIEQLQLMK